MYETMSKKTLEKITLGMGILLILIASISSYLNEPHNEKKSYSATVLGMAILDKGSNSAEPTLGIRLNTGKEIDFQVPLVNYSQRKVGEQITVSLSDKDLKIESTKGTISAFFYFLGSCFLLLFLLIWSSGVKNKTEH
jgi:hypothetical protein